MENANILLVCDDGQFGYQLTKRIQLRDVRLIETPDKFNAIRLTQAQKPYLVIVHSSRRELNDKLDVIAEIRSANLKIPIILISRHSCEERVIASLRAGVTDYFRSPCDFDELVQAIKKQLRIIDRCSNALQVLPDMPGIHGLIGQSKGMRGIKSFIQKIAETDSTVLITGETGTGKGLTARLVHHHSERRKGPFVPVNCPAIPDSLVESELFGYEKGAFTGADAAARGKFEAAQNGTLFLDEISDMGRLAQAKILRTIEDKENFRIGAKVGKMLDVRVIAATNCQPDLLIEKGRLRKDLYYRLNVARIHLPTLRERKEDIPLLAGHFFNKFNRKFKKQLSGLDDKALEILLNYNWPGNVRQLKNTLEACFIRACGPAIGPHDLPDELRRTFPSDNNKPTPERERIIACLVASKGNKSKAAQLLNWSRMTLYRKMSKYHLDSGVLTRRSA